MNLDADVSRLQAHGVAFAPAIAGAARRHGLDPQLLAAVAAQETGGPGSNAGRNVVGDGGHGHGVFQIDDRWHDFASTPAAMDPVRNADYAAGMLSGLIERYGGNIHRALSAYNAGSPDATGTKTAWGDGTAPGYADSVMRHYALLGGPGRPAPGIPQMPSPATTPQEEAVAELRQLIASLGTLSAQAACAPVAPPQTQTAGAQAPQPYRRPLTDYAGLINNADPSSDPNA